MDFQEGRAMKFKILMMWESMSIKMRNAMHANFKNCFGAGLFWYCLWFAPEMLAVQKWRTAPQSQKSSAHRTANIPVSHFCEAKVLAERGREAAPERLVYHKLTGSPYIAVHNYIDPLYFQVSLWRRNQEKLSIWLSVRACWKTPVYKISEKFVNDLLFFWK